MLERKIKILIAAVVILASTLIGYAYFIEPDILLVKEQKIGLECLENDLSDKFVQISDLHFTGDTKEAKIEQINKVIKEQNPAAVFLTGDLVSDETGTEKVIELAELIANEKPLYVVFGNWDYWALDYKVGEFKKKLENVGAEVLMNSAAEIFSGGEKLDVLGVKDPYTSGELRNDIEKASEGLKANDQSCRILLAHSPNIINEAEEKNIDLVLAGHTHGGQVYIPFLTKYIVPMKRPSGQGFIKGLYTAGNTKMYINQGIGISVLPFRFLVPPEVTVLKLEKGT